MTGQKFIFKSKTVWSAILTFAISVLPLILQGVETDFDPVLMGEIAALVISTFCTIRSRYVAYGSLYTPRGFPGRSYIPAWKERN